MGNLQVLFEVPKFIETGLASGALQRVGGVIVESSTRQVVAWLRDAGVVETVINVASGLPNPFGLILQAAQTALSLYDGHLTREAIQVLGQQIQTTTTLTALTATGQVVNLALSAATFPVILRRLSQLDNEIKKLGETIQEEFNRERDMQFEVALQAARDVFETRQDTTRHKAIRTAIDGLYEARENFLIDFNKTVQKEITNERLLIAQQFLIRALYAEISRIRCYLADDDLELAKQRLNEANAIFKTNTERLIKLWLGQHPAAYFHKDVASEHLSRFLRIQQSLRGFSRNDPVTIFEILDEMRSDFWNEDAIKDEYGNVFGQITRRPARKFSDRVKMLTENLTQCELLIENYERLQGFEMEIRTMRLSFPEWANLVNEKEIEKKGVAVIIDKDFLEELRQKSRSRSR